MNSLYQRQKVKILRATLYFTILTFIFSTAFSWSVIALATSCFWIPSLLFWWALYKYTFVGRWIEIIYYWILSRLLFQNASLSDWIWRMIYTLLMKWYPSQDWTVMNYGYAFMNGNGKVLDSYEDDPEIYRLQLYFFVSSQLPNLKSYQGLDILEVGSGRGGGLNFVQETLMPDHATGIDNAAGNIRFSRKRFRRTGNLEYIEANALELIQCVEEEEFDIVLNIQSSHCYVRMGDFLSQVNQVLKVNGLFLFCDVSTQERFTEIETQAKANSFEIQKKVNITPNVVAALKYEDQNKERILESLPEWIHFLARDLLAVEGTLIHNRLKSRELIYMAYVFKKVRTQQLIQWSPLSSSSFSSILSLVSMTTQTISL